MWVTDSQNIQVWFIRYLESFNLRNINIKELHCNVHIAVLGILFKQKHAANREAV